MPFEGNSYYLVTTDSCHSKATIFERIYKPEFVYVI